MDFAPLEELYRFIADQSAEVVQQYPWWPCAQGCADCCRYSLFLVSEYEWEYVLTAFAEIGRRRRDRVVEAARGIVTTKLGRFMPIRSWGDVVREAASERASCPFLDGRDLCVVYEKRPIICRLYGFFATPAGSGEQGTCYWCPRVFETANRHQVAAGVRGSVAAPSFLLVRDRMKEILRGRTATLVGWILQARHEGRI